MNQQNRPKKSTCYHGLTMPFLLVSGLVLLVSCQKNNLSSTEKSTPTKTAQPPTTLPSHQNNDYHTVPPGRQPAPPPPPPKRPISSQPPLAVVRPRPIEPQPIVHVRPPTEITLPLGTLPQPQITPPPTPRPRRPEPRPAPPEVEAPPKPSPPPPAPAPKVVERPPAPPKKTTRPAPPPDTSRAYFYEAGTLTVAPATKSLDIAIFVDTSPSMEDLRQKLAQEINRFVLELADRDDYNIAVFLGNDPGHPNFPGGRMFQTPNQNNEPLVIASATIRNLANSDKKLSPELRKTQAAEEAAKMLVAKMQGVAQHTARDHSPTKGEAGLLSLYLATQPQNIKNMQDNNFWREGAAKVILFIADENDVCTPSFDKRGNITGNFKLDSDRRDETTTYSDPQVCANSINGQRLTPELVLKAAQQAAQQANSNIFFTGALYEKTGPIKAEKGYQYAGDHERGRGYLDVINMGGGRIIPLDNKNYGTKLGESLANIGTWMETAMKYLEHFYLHDPAIPHNPKDIQTDSIYVEIRRPDGEVLNHIKNKDLQIGRSNPSTGIPVTIPFEKIKKIYQNEDTRPQKGLEPKIIIHYKTKSGQPATPHEKTFPDIRS